MIPDRLAWIERLEGGADWLARLPGLIDTAVARWSLDLGPAYEGSVLSYTAPHRRGPLVLKVPFPHRESRFEGDALAAWRGRGAVRLLDRADGALLLEKCEPGHALSTVSGVDGITVLVGILPRLWIAAAQPFGTLEDEAARWVADMPGAYEGAGEPFSRALLDAALDALTDLAGSQGEQVLLHQDLHGGNVLAARRETWLVIDPKPLIGEREFSIAPIVRSIELGEGRDALHDRFERLVGQLGLDRQRASGWALGQTLAWAFESGLWLQGHIDAAEWIAELT